jgi:hypothetical protein
MKDRWNGFEDATHGLARYAQHDARLGVIAHWPELGPAQVDNTVSRIALGVGLLLFGSTKMYRQTMLALFTWFLSVPFLAAQGKLAKLPSSPADAGASCSRVGEVLGRDVFAQTFLLKQDDGQMETVPFSRWTEFFKISPDSRSGRPREIEPTDIRLGDRLWVLLDLREASARLILVLERAPVKIAAVQQYAGGTMAMFPEKPSFERIEQLLAGANSASALKVSPPDLTRISARHGGTFPLMRIERIISGEEELPRGHGPMPVWGPVFSQVDRPGSGTGSNRQPRPVFKRHPIEVESLERLWRN